MYMVSTTIQEPNYDIKNVLLGVPALHQILIVQPGLPS